MSPQLLLVLIVAFVTASIAGLAGRKPLLYLPLYWALSVVALLIGQVVGRAAGIVAFCVGSVELGVGLVCTLTMFVCLRVAAVWYNQSRS